MQALFSFRGRIRRAQYWLMALIVSAIYFMGFGIVMGLIVMANAAAFERGQAPAIFWIFYGLSLIPMIWISFALMVKRWHDRDKSGWWALIVLIPIIGPFWALIECGFLDGTQGPNRFGPSPKGIGGPEKVF